MMLSKLILLLIIVNIIYMEPADEIKRIDETMVNIFNSPKKEHADQVFHLIDQYRSIVSKLFERLKQNGLDACPECRAVYNPGMADFLCYILTNYRINKLKKVFEWSQDTIDNFTALRSQTDDLWFDFVEAFVDAVRDKEAQIPLKSNITVYQK